MFNRQRKESQEWKVSEWQLVIAGFAVGLWVMWYWQQLWNGIFGV